MGFGWVSKKGAGFIYRFQCFIGFLFACEKRRELVDPVVFWIAFGGDVI